MKKISMLAIDTRRKDNRYIFIKYEGTSRIYFGQYTRVKQTFINGTGLYVEGSITTSSPDKAGKFMEPGVFFLFHGEYR